VPHEILTTITGSLGGALAVAVARALLALAWLPSRPGPSTDDSAETGK
jgi:hypothetical protein